MMGFYMLLEKREVERASTIMRLDCTGPRMVLEYNPERVSMVSDSLLSTVIYMECLRLALHHCDSRQKTPIDIYKIASDMIVAEYARFAIDTDEGRNSEILERLFPSYHRYSDIFSRYDFSFERDFHLEKVFEILCENEDEVREMSGRKDDCKDNDGESDDEDDSEDGQEGPRDAAGDDTDGLPDEREPGDGDGDGDRDAEDGPEEPDDSTGDDGDGGPGAEDGCQDDGAPGEGNPVPEDDYGVMEEYFNDSSAVTAWNNSSMNEDAIHDAAFDAEVSGTLAAMHGGVSGRIMEANAIGSVDVSELMRKFIGDITTDERIDTRMRRNRRFGLLYPGHRPERKPKILIAVDVSGSMTNHAQTCVDFVSSVSRDTDIDVCFWDTGCTLPGKTTRYDSSFEIRMGGGTDPSCVMEKLNDERLEYNGIIYLTDCYFDWECPDYERKVFIVRTDDGGDFPEWCDMERTALLSTIMEMVGK